MLEFFFKVDRGCQRFFEDIRHGKKFWADFEGCCLRLLDDVKGYWRLLRLLEFVKGCLRLFCGVSRLLSFTNL